MLWINDENVYVETIKYSDPVKVKVKVVLHSVKRMYTLSCSNLEIIQKDIQYFFKYPVQ
jgi:hypothetical protein